jgi:hypothetical protein
MTFPEYNAATNRKLLDRIAELRRREAVETDDDAYDAIVDARLDAEDEMLIAPVLCTQDVAAKIGIIASRFMCYERTDDPRWRDWIRPVVDQLWRPHLRLVGPAA